MSIKVAFAEQSTGVWVHQLYRDVSDEEIAKAMFVSIGDTQRVVIFDTDDAVVFVPTVEMESVPYFKSEHAI